MYQRVIPRDLFNEAKFLKCLGRIALLIHDGRDQHNNSTPQSLRIDFDNQAFQIEQDAGSGALFCRNLVVFAGEHKVEIVHPYNSKENYPVIFEGDEDEGDVFNDDGSFTQEFINYVGKLTPELSEWQMPILEENGSPDNSYHCANCEALFDMGNSYPQDTFCCSHCYHRYQGDPCPNDECEECAADPIDD